MCGAYYIYPEIGQPTIVLSGKRVSSSRQFFLTSSPSVTATQTERMICRIPAKKTGNIIAAQNRRAFVVPKILQYVDVSLTFSGMFGMKGGIYPLGKSIDFCNTCMGEPEHSIQFQTLVHAFPPSICAISEMQYILWDEWMQLSTLAHRGSGVSLFIR